MLDGIKNWFNSLGATVLGRLLPFVLILLILRKVRTWLSLHMKTIQP